MGNFKKNPKVRYVEHSFFFFSRINIILDFSVRIFKKKTHLKETKTREKRRDILGVNGIPPVLAIDPSIGSPIKLQLLDITRYRPAVMAWIRSAYQRGCSFRADTVSQPSGNNNHMPAACSGTFFLIE